MGIKAGDLLSGPGMDVGFCYATPDKVVCGGCGAAGGSGRLFAGVAWLGDVGMCMFRGAHEPPETPHGAGAGVGAVDSGGPERAAQCRATRLAPRHRLQHTASRRASCVCLCVCVCQKGAHWHQSCFVLFDWPTDEEIDIRTLRCARLCVCDRVSARPCLALVLQLDQNLTAMPLEADKGLGPLDPSLPPTHKYAPTANQNRHQDIWTSDGLDDKDDDAPMYGLRCLRGRASSQGHGMGDGKWGPWSPCRWRWPGHG